MIALKCAILLTMLLVGSFVYGEKQPVEIYVDDSYKPYSYTEANRAAGIYVDILRAVFEQMPSFDVRLTPIPWQRGKHMMEAGEGFGLAPVFFHAHDWPYLYPYSLHFYEEKIITVCREDVLATARTRWPEDFIGLHIQNVAGFDGWGGDHFRELIAQKQIHYSEVRGVENNIRMLELRRVDCILAEEFSFDNTYARLKKSRGYDVEVKYSELKKGPVIGLDPVYIGYSQTAIDQGKFPFHKKFMKEFDVALYKMKKNGEVSRIMRSSFHQQQPTTKP